jgi:L-arabinose isomerase
MGNHGIHGVQDLASVLKRMKRRFAIEAGHLIESNVLQRVTSWARAAACVRRLRTARVGRIGSEFAGMHDFAVEEDLLREKLGPQVRHAQPADLARWVQPAESVEVQRELKLDRERFDVSGVLPSAHVDSIRAGLALRRFVEENSLTAFTMNFESFTADCGVPTVPFLEASKAMSRGTGYAGENDVLTAALVGALAATFRDVTFTEMFCPDWKGGSVFLSHMGEMNVGLAARKPVLIANPYPWAKITPPVIAACSPKAGPAVLVNLAPGFEGTLSLILAPVEVLPEPDESRYQKNLRGWIKPQLRLERFLERYSACGGTHHSALALGVATEELERFAFFAGFPCNVLT